MREALGNALSTFAGAEDAFYVCLLNRKCEKREMTEERRAVHFPVCVCAECACGDVDLRSDQECDMP